MKITFTPAINKTVKTAKSNNHIQTAIENKNIKELPKYSMAELLGKTQIISFRGINTVEGDYIEHTCTEKTQTNGTITERIIFNKKNGNYSHQITDKNGGVIKSEEYYPSQEKEIITTYENDIATITTKNPNKTTVEKLDAENRRIYFEEIIEDTVIKEETDYERGRRVITHKVNDVLVKPITVIDLATRETVTDGDLVVDIFYDETNNEYTTKNIVTNRIHKKEKVDEKGKPIYSIEYNPETGLILKEKRYGKEYTEDTYTGKDPNRLVSSLFVSSDGREKEIVFYDEDGETVLSHTIFLHRKDGTLEEETRYNASQVIKEKIFYGKGESRTHLFYNEETHNKKSIKEYDKTGKFISETLFYEDGKTQKAKKEINKDGTFTIIQYNKDGIETKRNYYDNNKNLLSTEIYDLNTNSLEKTIEYDLKTGNKTLTIYDEEYELPINQTITDKNGTILNQTIFYGDGKTPHYKREYNPDRSYSDFAFDEKGKLIGEKKFNADGTQKA